jgi:hypothetical protein
MDQEPPVEIKLVTLPVDGNVPCDEIFFKPDEVVKLTSNDDPNLNLSSGQMGSESELGYELKVESGIFEPTY